MSMFNKSMKIGKGQKYDTSQVSDEGLTQAEIAKMDKKARKLIDIYNTDGQNGLSKIELAYAMDGFSSADTDYDGKLSDKELEAYANKINKHKGLSGDNAISGKDLKAFLKDVRKFTKGDTKASTGKTIDDDEIAKYVKSQGLTAVEGQEDLYQKDGKYIKIVRGDELVPQRVVKDGENFRTMTQAELDDETARERQAEIAKKAEAEGYKELNSDGSVYIKGDDTERMYIYDDANKGFVRAKKDSETSTYVAMSDDEMQAEDVNLVKLKQDAEQQQLKARDLANPKDYTVQMGEKLNDLLRRSLEAQGKEVNAENLAAAKKEFIKNNPNAVHKSSRGVEYLYAGDVVKIAGNLENKANAAEVKQAYRAQQAQKAEAEAKAKVEAEAKAKAEAEAKAKAEAAKTQESTQTSNTAKNIKSNVIKLNGADPGTGKLNNKDFVDVKGRGMCKYNPDQKGYELYTGEHDGYNYKNGKKVYQADNLMALTRDLKNYDESQGWTGKLEDAFLAKQSNRGTVKDRKNCIRTLYIYKSGNDIVVSVEYQGNGAGRYLNHKVTYKNTSELSCDVSKIYRDVMENYSKAWW